MTNPTQEAALRIPKAVRRLHLLAGLAVTILGSAHTIAVLRSAASGTLTDAADRLPGLLAIGAALVVPGGCMILASHPLARRNDLAAPLASVGLLAASLTGIAVAFGVLSLGPVVPILGLADLAALAGTALRMRRSAVPDGH